MPSVDNAPEPEASETITWLPPGMPARLGYYQLIRQLGQGGMGMVFEARHVLMQQRAAVKVLHAHLAAVPHLQQRFLREMTLLGALREHPNLIRATFAGEDRGLFYLVMDYVEGVDLSHLLERTGPLSLPSACAIVRQVALGLSAIHRAGLVHRDIKPSNLMLTEDGHIKILDLGLARLREQTRPQEELTPSDCQLGTYDYQAPEQAHDPRRVDIRADIYSLGCTFYKLLQGHAPYSHRTTPAQKLHAHGQEPFPTLEMSGELGGILQRMIAKDPAWRFAEPGELAQALEPQARPANLAALYQQQAAAPALQHPQPSTSTEGTGTTNASTLPPRRRWPFVFLALAGAATVALFALVMFAPALLPWNWSDHLDHHGSLERQPPSNFSTAGHQWPYPRVLDGLPRQEWQELLDREPQLLIWSDGSGASSRAFDPKLRQFTVNAQKTGLFQLGTLQHPHYSFSISLTMPRWTGGAGVFFGYHCPAPHLAKYQFLLVHQRLDPTKGTVFSLVRGKSAATRNELGIWSVPTRERIQEDVEPLYGEQTLEIHIVGAKLERVRFGGVDLPKLCRPDINREYTPEEALGGFGTFNVRSNCMYRKAGVLLHTIP